MTDHVIDTRVEAILERFIGGDAGSVYTAQCPYCLQTVEITSNSWWSGWSGLSTCICGHEWEVEIVAKIRILGPAT